MSQITLYYTYYGIKKNNGDCVQGRKYFRQTNMKLIFAIFFLSVAVSGLGGSAPRNVLFCDICVDIVTDIDEFLVSEPTEQAVIEFVSQVKHNKSRSKSNFFSLDLRCSRLYRSRLCGHLQGLDCGSSPDHY